MTNTKRAVSAVLSTLLGIAVVGTVGITLHTLSADPSGKLVATKSADTITVDGKSYPKATATLGIYPDSATAVKHGSKPTKKDYVQYGPSNHLVLPAHTYVTMTLHVYDSGGKLNNSYFGKVVGTFGGTMNVDGKDVNSISPDAVQHTFTLHGLPTSSQDPLFVSVPMPRVETKDNGDFIPTSDPGTNNEGHTVVFSFITGGRGEYVFNCEYPCGDGTYRSFGAAMSAYGYMSGKVSVA
jgi:hypothetical protein